MDKHYHWTVIAWNTMKKGNYYQAVSISVIGYQNEEDAMIVAKELIIRKNYVLSSVFECNTCKFQSQMNNHLKEMTDKI